MKSFSLALLSIFGSPKSFLICVPLTLPTCGADKVYPCSPNPCQNGAVCDDGINEFRCKCSDDFTGPTCNQKGKYTAEFTGSCDQQGRYIKKYWRLVQGSYGGAVNKCNIYVTFNVHP